MERTYDEINEVLKTFLDSELQLLHIETDSVKLVMSKAITGSAVPVVSGNGPFHSAAASSAPPAPDVEPTVKVAVDKTAAGTDAATPAKAVNTTATTDRESLVAVKSPCIGVFYRRPGPDQPPFVEVGDQVATDDPVCLIEVMKLFNSVSAQTAGRVVEICVNDATLVEYGQTLMIIDPS